MAITEIRSTLPQRSPKPLIVPCTCAAPASTAASELATARSQSLWQWMPTGTRQPVAGRAGDGGDFLGHAAAVGVAEHDQPRPGLGRGLDGLQRVVGIRLPAVEEVLGVEDHLAAVLRPEKRTLSAIMARFSSQAGAKHFA